VRLWTIYDVACPFCGAGLGKSCQVVRGAGAGRLLAFAHEHRRTAYRIAKAAEPRPIAPVESRP
jgi:hypothetical protein